MPALAALALMLLGYRLSEGTPPIDVAPTSETQAVVAQPTPELAKPGRLPASAQITTAGQPGPTPTGMPDLPLQRQEARLSALGRFQFENLPEIDGCLGPTPAPRRPQPFRVHFERASVASEAASAHFMATQVDPLTENSPESLMACVRKIVGHPLELPAGTVSPGQTELQEVITLPLPTQM